MSNKSRDVHFHVPDAITTHHELGDVPFTTTPWQSGKTTATIAFVEEVEKRFLERRAYAFSVRAQLVAAVTALKNGERSLTEELDIDEFVKHGFPR